MANCAKWAARSRSELCPDCSGDDGVVHPLRHGERSWPITPQAWFPWTSLRSRPSPGACCSSSCSLRINADESFTFAITDHPTAAWTAQQIIEAFPDDTAPRWLLRDRDAIYGDVFRRRVAGMGITEVITSPSSPWQNPYAERLIGSLRRECLDHVIVLSRTHLRRMLARYVFYYYGARTHLFLEKDAPTPRRVQVPSEGRVVAFAEVGGLHHRYERRAA